MVLPLEGTLRPGSTAAAVLLLHLLLHHLLHLLLLLLLLLLLHLHEIAPEVGKGVAVFVNQHGR